VTALEHTLTIRRPFALGRPPSPHQYPQKTTLFHFSTLSRPRGACQHGRPPKREGTN